VVDHYETLEVSPLASPEVIRAAYRSLMQRFHPDRNPGDPIAATRAANVAAAFEVLSDPQKRASYDAGLQAANRPETAATPSARAEPGVAAAQVARVRPAPVTRGPVRTALPSQWRREIFLWLLAIVVAAGGLFLSRSRTGPDPAAELLEIRAAIASGSTAEVERRRLYARKLALIEQHPELQRRESAERSEDMAARTFPLLASPLVVRVSRSPSNPGPPLELTLPAASLLVGSFDAPNLLDHMGRHRERLVQDLAARLAKMDGDRVGRQQVEERLKRVIAESVMASLGIEPGTEYPSTYFESPGAYGVVGVVLPDRFSLVQIESPP
jgi:curved DNA-binding protein CbpA